MDTKILAKRYRYLWTGEAVSATLFVVLLVTSAVWEGSWVKLDCSSPIVIKEKLAQKQSQTPEFYTIMVKRESGYDSSSGDWQYLIINAAQTRIEKPSDIESCQSCQRRGQKHPISSRAPICRLNKIRS
jgi:hypothetical protein